MYSGQWVALLLFIFTQADGSILDDKQCNHKFEQKCGDVNNYSVVQNNPSVFNYCTAEDVPDNIHFGVRSSGIDGGILTDSVKIQFAHPKRKCALGVTLLVNPSIENERECEEYKFKVDDTSNVHSKERTVCFLRNTNLLVKYNDNSTSLCEDNIMGLWFQHIFTGCYALQFHIGSQKYAIRGHKFLNTTYQRTEVIEPQFICNYETYYNPNERHEVTNTTFTNTNFTLDTSLPVHTGDSLELGLISPWNKNSGKGCVWKNEPLLFSQKIELNPNVKKDNCSIQLTQTVNGEHIKTIQCNFRVKTTKTTKTADYCFVFYIIDDRCYKNTIWKPQNANAMMPCTWIQRCKNVSLHKNSEIIISDKSQGANLYLLLPIVATVLIISTIIGILCFWHLCIRKKEITLYVNPQHDDFLNSACFESTDLNIIDNNEKEIDHDNLSCDDIVLLYTKNSISFMALMKDFRETLAKICSCSVYDWYDEAEWNNVAKIGPVSWFTKLFNGKCRVVWIDTPTTRSIVISRESDSGLNKLCKYHEIGDFRDVAFPVVLELAKRNTNDAHQYRRHFVVRFEGLESTANVNDPFLDLSPHARYCMPQHLTQLCLDLSTVKSLIPKYQLKAEENLLQQRLRLVKIESIM